jgi:hypothetical protein
MGTFESRQFIDTHLQLLTGSRWSDRDVLRARELVPAHCEDLLALFRDYPLAGHYVYPMVATTTHIPFSLVNGSEFIDEATAVYPGIVSTELGWLPFAIDTTGGGDPLCVRADDVDRSGIMLALHDEAIEADRFRRHGLRLVAANFVELLAKSFRFSS